jgi:hypothetical protein
VYELTTRDIQMSPLSSIARTRVTQGKGLPIYTLHPIPNMVHAVKVVNTVHTQSTCIFDAPITEMEPEINSRLDIDRSS